MNENNNPEQKKKPEEEKLDPQPGVFYIEAHDAESGDPVTMMSPLKIPHLVEDLKHTVQKYGESFSNQIITVFTYVPEGRASQDGKEGKVTLKRVVVSQGQPEVVIKQLEEMCLTKGQLANDIMNTLGQMAKRSGLIAASITYLVEEGDDVLTGGNTMMFVPKEGFTDTHASQLYNSLRAHSEELKDMLKKDGHTVHDQDGPQLLQPGDPGFIMPQD